MFKWCNRHVINKNRIWYMPTWWNVFNLFFRNEHPKFGWFEVKRASCKQLLRPAEYRTAQQPASLGISYLHSLLAKIIITSFVLIHIEVRTHTKERQTLTTGGINHYNFRESSKPKNVHLVVRRENKCDFKWSVETRSDKWNICQHLLCHTAYFSLSHLHISPNERRVVRKHAQVSARKRKSHATNKPELRSLPGLKARLLTVGESLSQQMVLDTLVLKFPSNLKEAQTGKTLKNLWKTSKAICWQSGSGFSLSTSGFTTPRLLCPIKLNSQVSHAPLTVY